MNTAILNVITDEAEKYKYLEISWKENDRPYSQKFESGEMCSDFYEYQVLMSGESFSKICPIVMYGSSFDDFMMDNTEGYVCSYVNTKPKDRPFYTFDELEHIHNFNKIVHVVSKEGHKNMLDLIEYIKNNAE